MRQKRTPLAAMLFVVAAFSVLTSVANANHRSTDVIIEWDELLQQNLAGPPFSQVRVYAMLHIAMADAIVAIDGRYEPYHVHTRAPQGASAEAAAAQAAHDVLVALIPAAQSAFASALQGQLAKIPNGPRLLGTAVGRRVAAEVLDWRSNDGAATANPQPSAFLPSTLPGIWRQTASGSVQYSLWGSAEPFGILTTTQFLPAPFPQLESAEYAHDFNEVKAKGRATGSTRTPEETRFALLFAGVAPYANVTNAFRLWHNVARDVAKTRRLSLVETARLFALLSASVHDSLQTSHASKFVYRLWRPETAIDQAGVDNNNDTAAETAWPPLLVTPPYPSHASNMACIGTGAARMLANVFDGDTQRFTATWYAAGSPAVVVHSQPYTSFAALAQDEGDSRIWGGIHFGFEIDTSQVSCTQVADFIFDNYMGRRRSH
jgi:hypothetical protein